MNLTREQDEALVKISKWVKRGKSAGWMFTLAGFAGTGKTTLLQHLVGSLGRSFIVAAPTGKAANVLRTKIPGLEVKTVHQLLYKPMEQSTKLLEALESQLLEAQNNNAPTTELKLSIKEEKERLSKEKVGFARNEGTQLNPESLVIVDEASMVSEGMLRDFEATGCQALFVGDSGQLPPVRDSSWFIDWEHDARLENVMRQALDSPIIRLSMAVREGKRALDGYDSGDCVITSKANVLKETWLSADQVLTGGNESRRRINRFFRKAKGLADMPLPTEGEKMICLKNDHYKDPVWINGNQFTSRGATNLDGEDYLAMVYDGITQSIPFYAYHCQLHYDPTLQEEPREVRRGLFECDYAYGITVHKSQGSEWQFVIVADDCMQINNSEFRKRWLYTAITRAKSRLIIAR